MLDDDLKIDFFGDSILELSKKKMPKSQKNHFHALISYRPPRLVIGKLSWCISFYAFDPVLGELRKKRIKLNHIKSVLTRRIYANELIKRLNEKLIGGWSPWVESENSNAYKLFSDVCENFRKLLSRQLNSELIRPESFSSYTSYLKNIETYNEEKGQIRYIYQFDQSFLMRFLDYIYIERENTAQTRNNYLGFLRLFSGYLVEHQYLKSKPTDGITRLGRKSMQKKQRTVIPNDVLLSIGNYLRERNKHMLLACYVLHLCFIRPKEMARLKIGNINLQKSTILIPAEASKNRSSATVTIPDTLKELFLDLQINQYPGAYYLFSDGCKPGASFREEKQFRDYWNNHVKKDLKLPSQYKFYSLKDTGITDLFRSGVDSLSIRDQARHYNISITDTYTPRDIQEANEKIKSNTKKF
jgi:integrase